MKRIITLTITDLETQRAIVPMVEDLMLEMVIEDHDNDMALSRCDYATRMLWGVFGDDDYGSEMLWHDTMDKVGIAICASCGDHFRTDDMTEVVDEDEVTVWACDQHKGDYGEYD
jgi:hypothetical protein